MNREKTQTFTQQSPSFSHPGPVSLKSVPDEGFPVGIRCSCSTANHTRNPPPPHKKREKHPLRIWNIVELIFLIWLSKEKIKLCCRGECLRCRSRRNSKSQVILRGQVDSSTLHPLSMTTGGGWDLAKIWPHTLRQRTWTQCSDCWNVVSGIC